MNRAPGRPDVAPTPWRRPVAAAVWVLCGLCWVGVAFVPWADTGSLSRSTLVQLAGLVRSGVLTSVPGWVPALTVVLPLLGAVIVAMAVPPLPWWSRGLPWSVAVLLWSAMTHAVVGLAPAGWGPGPWLGVAGTVLGLLALAVSPRAGRGGPVSNLLPTTNARGKT